MNVKRFIEVIQGYYNMAYPETTGRAVARYLTTWTEAELDELSAITVKMFSGRFNKLPDIAVFEEFRPDVLERCRLQPVADVLQIEDKSEYASPEEIQALTDHFTKTIFRKVNHG